MKPKARKTRPAPKELVLHIGVHKTGSTSIQGMLRSRADELAQLGLLFVGTGRNEDGNHAALAQAALSSAPASAANAEEAPGLWREALAEIAGSPCTTALISSEDFSLLDGRDVARLGRWLETAGVRTTVLVFLREQTEVLRSNYIELLKQGKIESDFERYLALASVEFDPAASLDRFDYQRMLEPWLAAFGREGIRALEYRAGRDSVALFMQAIGQPRTVSTRKQPRLNTSPSNRAVAALLLVNRVLALYADLQPERRTQIAYGTYESALMRYPEAADPLPVGQRWREALAERYLQSNRWLRTTFGVRLTMPRARAAAAATTLPEEDVAHWLQRAQDDVAYSRSLVFAATEPIVVEGGAAAHVGETRPSAPAAHLTAAAVDVMTAAPTPTAPPPPPATEPRRPARNAAGTMFDDPEEFAAADVPTRRHGARERMDWNFPLDHPHLRRRLYERHLGGLDPISFAFARLGSGPARHALEVGCGRGELARALRAAGLCQRLEAFDDDAEAIAAARAEATRAGLDGLHFFHADFASVSLPAAQFDFVYASDALHRVGDLEALFARLHASMRPDGLLFAKEYIGPARMQYAPAHLDWIDRVLRCLPPEKRRERGSPGAVRERFQPLAAADFERTGSREMIRSDEIVPVMRNWFDVEVLSLGMTLVYDALRGLVHHFDPDDPADVALLDALLLADDAVERGGLVPACFACLVARPRPIGVPA